MVLEMNASQVLEHIQVNNIILAAAGDGVRNGLAVSERGAGANMSVDVATGTAMIGGTAYTEGSTVNLAIEAAHATLHRKDLITYDPVTSNPVVTKGANHAGGTGDPIYPPDIPAGDILLAIIEVAAAATTITSGEITDCIVEITKLDELGTPSDSTTLDASTAVHGLLKKLPNNAAQYLNGVGVWATPAGAGDMSKSVYDPNDDGIIASAQIGNLPASKITSGTLPVTRGGTGVTSSASVADVNADKLDGQHAGNASGQVALSNGVVCVNLWADRLDGYHAGNSASMIPISNGTVCGNLNADEVDGCDAGTGNGNVLKLPSIASGYLLAGVSSAITTLAPGTNGYQLTSQGAGNVLTWAAASDLIFSDTHCPKCGQEFQDGDDLILHVIGHNEAGDILTLPMHLSCANEPKKTVMVQRKVMEDHFILDEDSGEIRTTRVQKTAKRTVTKHKLKEGYSIDDRTGTACKVKHRAAVHDLKEALEEIEETIEEPVYEDVEYTL